MQYGRACINERFHIVEHSTACSPPMERHNSPVRLTALCEDVLKYGNLALPVAATLGAAIKTDLTDVTRLGQKAVEQREFVTSLMG